MTKQKQILVCDFHIGLNMVQVATLEKLGAAVKLLSLSDSIDKVQISQPSLNADEHYILQCIKQLYHVNVRRVRSSMWAKLVQPLKITSNTVWYGQSWSPQKNKDLCKIVGMDTMEEIFSQYDAYLVSFPPSMAHLFLFLAETFDKQLILNVGHRFNIGVGSRQENEAMISLLEYLHTHPRHVLASCSEYDCQYVKYYMGFEPQRLPAVCNHFELALNTPTLESVLIGPVNFINKDIEEKLNLLSHHWCQQHKRRQIEFSLIRTIYPRYRYEDLARHPAVVIFPYSAYSVSMLELYELNIPFFVPSPDMIIQYEILLDRALHPIYCSEKQYSALDVSGQSNLLYSPNSYGIDDQKHWLQFCFFYQVKNAIIWHSEKDLMEKLATTDLEQVRHNMYAENITRRANTQKDWKTIATADSGSLDSG